MQPFLAVLTATYNHEKFVAQAIESVLMQETSFSVKHFIFDDCSTDKTSEICQSYKTRNPNRIEIYKTEENNIIENSKNLYRVARLSNAKYIALLEGDDYWTDPLKLQKQVDYLESHPEIVCTHHRVNAVDENDNFKHLSKENPVISSTNDLISRKCYVSTLSLVFRNIFIDNQFPDFFFKSLSGDYNLSIILSKYGKFYFFDEVMGCYRQHDKGITNDMNNSSDNQIKHFINKIDVLFDLNEYLNGMYKDMIFNEIQTNYHNIILKLSKNSVINDDIKITLKNIREKLPVRLKIKILFREYFNDLITKIRIFI